VSTHGVRSSTTDRRLRCMMTTFSLRVVGGSQRVRAAEFQHFVKSPRPKPDTDWTPGGSRRPVSVRRERGVRARRSRAIAGDRLEARSKGLRSRPAWRFRERKKAASQFLEILQGMAMHWVLSSCRRTSKGVLSRSALVPTPTMWTRPSWWCAAEAQDRHADATALRRRATLPLTSDA